MSVRQDSDGKRAITLGRLTLHPLTGDLVDSDGKLVNLSKTETKLLCHLADHANQSVSAEDLLTEVWEYSAQAVTRTLSTTMYRLRRKVEPDPTEPRFLLRTRNGYMLRVETLALQVATRLHEPSTRWFGNEEQITAIATRPSRVVTLVGPGGVGKTRLATRVASKMDADLAGGVVVVGLAGLDTEAQVVGAVVDALGIQPGRQDPLVMAASALGGRGPCLMVFDDCERHLPEVRKILNSFLKATSESRFLMTSRVRIDVNGEDLVTVEALEPDRAIGMLVDRVAKHGTTWSADDPSVHRLVEALDRLPLALELLAPKARFASPGELLKRMNQRFVLLRGQGQRQAHQSIESVIEDSWELLPEVARNALARLSICAGSFDVVVAEGLIVTQSDAPAFDVLATLVDHSMLQTNATNRFYLLESVRAFARRHLVDRSAPMEALARVLADRCRTALCRAGRYSSEEFHRDRVLLRQVCQHARDVESRAWCVAALSWCQDHAVAVTAQERARMEEQVSPLARMHLRYSDIGNSDRGTQLQQVLTEAVNLGEDALALRLELMVLMWEPIKPDLDKAERLLARARAQGGLLEAVALRALASHLLILEQFPRAAALLEEAARTVEPENNLDLKTVIQINLAMCKALSGETREAIALLEDVIEQTAGILSHRSGPGLALFHLGNTLHSDGQIERAMEAFDDCIRLSERKADTASLFQLQTARHMALLDLDRPHEAVEGLLRIAAALSPQQAAIPTGFAARACLLSGEYERARRLNGPLLNHEIAMVRAVSQGVEACLHWFDGKPDLALERLSGTFDDPASQRIWAVFWALPRVAMMHHLSSTQAMEALARAERWYQDKHYRIGLDACRLLNASIRGQPEPPEAIHSSYSRLALLVWTHHPLGAVQPKDGA